MEFATLLEWTGCVTGLTGAALLAFHFRYSGYGWLFFLASNGCWIAFALMSGVAGIGIQHVGFLLTSLIGVYRWLIDNRKDPVTQRTTGS